MAPAEPEEDLVTTADLLELELQFFDVPCNGCSRDDGGDAVLFQCEVYDWGQSQGLMVDFTRQLTITNIVGEFSHLEQLHATLFYPAALAADQDIAISLWNTECENLADFRQKVAESAAYRLTEKVPAGELKIHQERV